MYNIRCSEILWVGPLSLFENVTSVFHFHGVRDDEKYVIQ